MKLNKTIKIKIKKPQKKKQKKNNIINQAKLIEKALIEDNKKDVKNKKKTTKPKIKTISSKKLNNCKTKGSLKQFNDLVEEKQKIDESFSDNNSENNVNDATINITNSIPIKDSNFK